MILILALLSLIFAIVSLWWCTKLYDYYVKLKKYPGPTPLPIIGNAHYFKNGSGKYLKFCLAKSCTNYYILLILKMKCYTINISIIYF